MKIVLGLLATLLSVSSSFADHEKYVCRELSGQTKYSVILTALTQHDQMIENGPYLYKIEVYNHAEDNYSPVLETMGTVWTEDVNFYFLSDDTKTDFKIFLDEMDQGSLTLDGKDIPGTFVCF